MSLSDSSAPSEASGNPSNSEMFFIVGRGRSGTTLLSTILNRSPSVAVAPESLFIMNLHRKYGGATWDQATIESFYEDIWLEGRMIDWELDREGLLEWLLRHGIGSDFPTVCRIVYARYAHDHGKGVPQLLGDKNPHYALFVERLISIYPSSKFIYIVRDFRDNICSYKQMAFDTNNTPALAYRWHYYNQALTEISSRHPDKFFTVRYEDLAEDPHKNINGICDFLGIDFGADMAEGAAAGLAPEVSWHSNLESPVNLSRVNRWKDTLTPREAEVANTICSGIARRFGYVEDEESIVRLSPSELLGRGYGWLLTRLEIMLFNFPLGVRATLIRLYRTITGTHALSGERRL